jgi:transposase
MTNRATRWSLDDRAFTIVNEAHRRALGRSTIRRILADADLKPHHSVCWLNSHDPDFDAKAQDICLLYQNAFRLHPQGRRVIGSDEKTGMRILGRKYPTQPPRPCLVDAAGQPIRGGKPAKREFEHVRYGTRSLPTSFVVPTGKVVWDLGETRASLDGVAHLQHVRQRYPDQKGYAGVVDNLNTHWSRDVRRLVAEWRSVPLVKRDLQGGAQRRAFLSDPSQKVVFHVTPPHGSRLNPVERFCRVVSRQFVRRGEGASAAVARLAGRRQRPHGASVSLDVYWGAIGVQYAVQPDQPPAAAWPGRVGSSTECLRTC